MQRLARHEPFEQIGDRQAAAAGLERHGLGDPHRQIAGGPLRSQLHLHAVGIAAQAGFVLPREEIATLGRFAAGQGGQRNLRIVKMIDQALPRIGVVLQARVQARLLENHLVAHARPRRSSPRFPASTLR